MQREKLKKIGLWLLTIALIAAHIFFRSQANAEQTSWKEVHSRNGDCRVAFPTDPQMIEKQLNLDEDGLSLFYDIYLAPYNEHSICVLLVAQYPKPISSGSEVVGLEGLLKGIIGQHPDNRVVFAELVSMKGAPALNFMVESGKNFFRGQAVMVENKLYLIAIEGLKLHFEEAVFQKFLKSFSIQSRSVLQKP